MIINKKRNGAESVAPERRHGLSAFEEFEGSEKSDKVTDDLYAPDTYLTSKEYGVPSVLLNFELNFDHMLEEFFSKANPDEFNTSFLDATINRLEAEALASLDIQRNEHLFGGIPHILMAWKQGQADYEGMRKRVRQELEEVEDDILEYKRIRYKGTSLEGYASRFHKTVFNDSTNRKEN